MLALAADDWRRDGRKRMWVAQLDPAPDIRTNPILLCQQFATECVGSVRFAVRGPSATGNKAVVMRLASGQGDTNRQPTGIDDSVNLGRQSASRPAHQLFTVRS